MSPHIALPSERPDIAPHRPDPESLLGRFAAAADAGKTIALVVAKEPRAVVVYYFRDASRAGETLDRLARLRLSPAVAYVSAGDGNHCAAAQVDAASVLTLRTIDWLARLIIGRAARFRTGKPRAVASKTRPRSFGPEEARGATAAVTSPKRSLAMRSRRPRT